MNLIEKLQTRYATKIFDNSKKISSQDLEEIINAFILTPSSYWLQPWKLVIVENQELRECLVEFSYNQKQVTEASHLLVLTRINKIDDNFVDDYLNDITKIRWVNREDLTWYENMMKQSLAYKNTEEKNDWAAKQLYIALGNLMTFLAFKWIDSCPMEWFVNSKYDEILWLDKLWLSSVLVLPIWYRSENDHYAKLQKVRKSSDEIVVIL